MSAVMEEEIKRWTANQVPHNDVHELIGLMVNHSATGAILVTSGEFTRYAIESANKHGHVQLIDGARLREMLGPLPQEEPDAEFSRTARVADSEPQGRSRSRRRNRRDDGLGQMVGKLTLR